MYAIRSYYDGKFVMEVNYDYSKDLLHFCLERGIPFIYASSAATYGGRNDNRNNFV